MKKLVNLLGMGGMALLIYCFVMKFTGHRTIEWGFINTGLNSGLVLSVSLLMAAVFLRLSIKEEKDADTRKTANSVLLSWVGSIALAGLVFGLVLFYAIVSSNKISDPKVIKRFNQLFYNSDIFNQTKWLGIENLNNPCDCWIMQEIITEIKPDFVIETGTYKGSTSLFYAMVLREVNKNGKVITVDIAKNIDEASKRDLFKERVEFIEGSSTSPEVIDAISKRVKGCKVVVTFDSDHTKEHVLKELNLYSNFVSLGSYMVVQDTVLGGHPVNPNFGPGPMEAVEEFLKTNKNFEIDHSRERFLVTWYPSGYLKRIK